MGKAIYKNFSTQANTELDRLMGFSFKKCIETIHDMDTFKKADIAAQIQPTLDSLYIQTERYGNPDYDLEDQIGPDIFLYIMSKIKRYENVLYWLYEIDILMGETDIDRLIAEAEERIAATGCDTRIRMKKGEDGKRHKVVVNAKEDLATLRADKASMQCNTDDILAQAKLMAAKYFK
jgi:hypothetical protein